MSWCRKTGRHRLAVLLGLRQSSHIFDRAMDIRWMIFATRAFVDMAIAQLIDLALEGFVAKICGMPIWRV